MNRRDFIIKWLFYSLATLLFVLIQGFLLNRLPLWGGIHPFLLPMLAVMPSLMEPRDEGLVFAVVFGFICDLILPASMPVTYLISFLAAALLGSLISTRMQSGLPNALLCCFLSLFLCDLLQYVTAPRHAIPPLTALSIFGRELVLSLPFSPLIYWLDRKICLRMLDI